MGTTVSDRVLHPTNANIFSGRVKSRGIRLDPGVINTLRDKNSISMRMSKFFEKMLPYYGWSQLFFPVTDCGSAQMVLLEKLMDTDSVEAEISLGYELNARYSAYITETTPFCESVKIRI